MKSYIIDIAAGLMLFGSAEAGDYPGDQQPKNYIEASFTPQQPRRMPVEPFDDLPEKLEDFFKKEDSSTPGFYKD